MLRPTSEVHSSNSFLNTSPNSTSTTSSLTRTTLKLVIAAWTTWNLSSTNTTRITPRTNFSHKRLWKPQYWSWRIASRWNVTGETSFLCLKIFGQPYNIKSRPIELLISTDTDTLNEIWKLCFKSVCKIIFY